VAGIAFALIASVCWGTADFLGGLYSRRLPVVLVLFAVQAGGLVVIAVVLAAAASPAPDARAAVAALAAGAAGVAALAAFYRALAIGTMSIVAPVSATGVALPVVVGVATGESLTTPVAIGLVVTVAGVILASSESAGGGAPSGGLRSVGLALLSAVGFGTFFVAYDVAADGSVPWAMFLSRIIGVAPLGVLALGRARASPRDLAALAGVGLIDASAIGLYALANTHAALAVVSVVGSLYPVATVVLARLVLRERIRPVQAAGVAAALTGVALIASG
jgi:drug/metabolite transporter (DMT)-like permease